MLSGHRALDALERDLARIPQLAEVPLPQPVSVGFDQIERWGSLDARSVDDLASGDDVPWCLRFGWTGTGFATRREQFRPITRRPSITDFSCDIRDVEGLSCTKSRMESFGTLDEFAIARCRDLVGRPTLEWLRKILGHAGGKIARDGFFSVKSWDGRIFWLNSDASHHFAAARFIAGKLMTPVLLRKPLHVESLDDDEVASLTAANDMFAISATARLSFCTTLSTHEVPHGLLRYPRPLDGWWIVLLPKVERRSAFVAKILRRSGLMDVGKHLLDLCARQRSVAPNVRAGR